jgi:hypothetical protein
MQRLEQIIVDSVGRTSSSLNFPALQIRSKSSPPAAYSITIARWEGVRNTCILQTNQQFLRVSWLILHVLVFQLLGRFRLHGLLGFSALLLSSLQKNTLLSHLLEPDYIGVPQRPVIHDFTLHVLINLPGEAELNPLGL